MDVCEVSEVRIIPCEISTKCKFIKGKNASISFDFTPKFVSQKLKASVYSVAATDVPFTSFGKKDARLYTNCPTETGKKQTFLYTVHINKKWPQGSFPIKWKVWNEENDQELCCFRVKI